MNELFLIFIFLSGLVLSLPFRESLNFHVIIYSAFFFGLLFWALLGVVLLVLGIKYSLFNFSLGYLFLIVAIVLIELKHNSFIFTKNQLLELFVSIIVFSAITYISNSMNLVNASPDSFEIIAFGQSLAYEGGLNANNQFLLALWGIMLPIIQSASVFFNIDYIQVTVVGGVNFLVLFYCLINRILKSITKERIVRIILNILSLLTLVSTFYFLYSFTYIHNNFLSSVFISISVLSLWLAVNEKSYSLFLYSIVFIGGFAFLRTESIIYVLVFILLIDLLLPFSKKEKLKVLIPFALIFFFWYSMVLFTINNQSDILTPEKVILVLIILGFFTGYYMVSDWNYFYHIKNNMVKLIFGGLIILLIIFTVNHPSHFVTNLNSIFENLLDRDWWMSSWWIIGLLLILAGILKPFPYHQVFVFMFLSFMLLLLLFGFMRVPFRVGIGDSANRIMLHIFPITLSYIVIIYAHAIERVNKLLH